MSYNIALKSFGITFKISIKRYFWDELHSSKCYRRYPVTMLIRQNFQCRTADNAVSERRELSTLIMCLQLNVLDLTSDRAFLRVIA